MSENPGETATTERTTFSRTTSIATMINADATTAWRLLTTAARYPEWNSTIVSLAGVSREDVRKLVAVNTGRVLDG